MSIVIVLILVFLGQDFNVFSESGYDKANFHHKHARRLIYFSEPPKKGEVQRVEKVKNIKKAPSLELYSNIELEGTPVLSLGAPGVTYKGSIICSWHEGQFSAHSKNGVGSHLRFCPATLPLFTFEEGGDGSGASAIYLGFSFIAHNRVKGVFVTKFKGDKLYFKIDNERTWNFYRSKFEMNYLVLKELRENKAFTDFIVKSRSCLKKINISECLKEMIPKVQTLKIPNTFYRKLGDDIQSGGGLSINGTDSAIPVYVKCKTDKALKRYGAGYLNEEEFVNCVSDHKEVRQEIQYCLNIRNPKSIEFENLDYQESVFKKISENISNPDQYLKINLSGDLFKCTLYRVKGMWVLAKLFPNISKISKMNELDILEVDLSKRWPFRRIKKSK